MTKLRLRDDVWLQLQYDDTTRFGSMVSGRIETELRARVEPVVSPLIAAQWRDVDHLAAYRAFHDATADLYLDAQTLRDDCLFPDPRRVKPAALIVHRLTDGQHQSLGRIALAPTLTAHLADWIGAWQRGEARPDIGPAARLHDVLASIGALTNEPALAPIATPGLVYVGHACAQLISARSRVIVDPFLPAHDSSAAYRPLTIDQLAPTVVLITHAHPDHFDIGSLLRFGADCDIVVPRVARESALTIDMAARLRELGFRRVRVLGWHESATFGDVTVRALPFYGEQPGDGERLHAEVRNSGNLYTVESAGLRAAFTADAGSDPLGDVRRVARADRLHHGPIDWLFAGCRSWSLYPAQLLRSSVRRYALFIPASEWTRRHQLMAGADQALDVAESWGARHATPYADGGAPWYWALGLGPDLGRAATADRHFDPHPEVLQQAARHRSSWGEQAIASPVRATVIRPGAVISANDRAAPATPAQRWPYPCVDLDQLPTSDHNELLATGRKKALLRVLAGELASARGIAVSSADVQQLSNHIRYAAGLTKRDDMLRWLAQVNLSLDQFTDLMREWAHCNALEALYAPEIEQRLPGQLALHAMRAATSLIAPAANEPIAELDSIPHKGHA